QLIASWKAKLQSSTAVASASSAPVKSPTVTPSIEKDPELSSADGAPPVMQPVMQALAVSPSSVIQPRPKRVPKPLESRPMIPETSTSPIESMPVPSLNLNLKKRQLVRVMDDVDVHDQSPVRDVPESSALGDANM